MANIKVGWKEQEEFYTRGSCSSFPDHRQLEVGIGRAGEHHLATTRRGENNDLKCSEQSPLQSIWHCSRGGQAYIVPVPCATSKREATQG